MTRAILTTPFLSCFVLFDCLFHSVYYYDDCQGLTSNCFFVYPGRVLKTPKDGILRGYARHRVVQAAQALGYHVEQGPVSLDEAPAWQEVFVTSAIRLVQPVQTIVQRQQQGKGNDGLPTEVWKSPSSSEFSVAKGILNRILDEEQL